MSDEAVVWKFAFGALVLLFCAVSFVARDERRPLAVRSEPVVPALPAPQPAAIVPPPPAASEPADVPDVQETPPVRIRIALREPPRGVKAKALKPRKPPRHLAASVKQVQPRHAQRRASPYVAGRQHYPFDPRERWRSREAA